LGMESVSGRTAGLDLGICCRGAAPEPVFADPDAARAVATNRSLVRNPSLRMVCILVSPQEHMRAACSTFPWPTV